MHTDRAALLQALQFISVAVQQALLTKSTKPLLLQELQVATFDDEQSLQRFIVELQHRFPSLFGHFPAVHAEHLPLTVAQSVQESTELVQQ